MEPAFVISMVSIPVFFLSVVAFVLFLRARSNKQNTRK